MLDGASDSADPAAVALVHRLPASHAPAASAACSGALIASNVVVTAAHCVADAHGADFDVVVGSKPDAPAGERAAVEEILVHPGYDPEAHAFDIALLRLASKLTVAPFSSSADASSWLVEGAPVRAIGFGVDGTANAFPDLKRSGTLRVSALGPDSFDAVPAPSMTCTGDSGGPVLARDAAGTEQLVGITVSGDAGCKRLAHNQRLDSLSANFVRPFVEQAELQAAPSSCGFVPAGPSASALPLACVLLLVTRRSRLLRRSRRGLGHASFFGGVSGVAQLGGALRIAAATLVARVLRTTAGKLPSGSGAGSSSASGGGAAGALPGSGAA